MPEIEFDLTDLSPELQFFVASLLPDKDLMNLRQTSSFHRRLVDEIILSKENLPVLLEKISHDQLISFVNTYQKLYEQAFADKISTPKNLDIIFNKLTGNEALEFIQTYRDLYDQQFDNILKNFFNNSPSTLAAFLISMDRESAYKFTQIYPNWFAEKVESGKASIEEKMCYMLTVDDVNKIDYKVAQEVYQERQNVHTKLGADVDPAVMLKLSQVAASLGVMYYATRLLQDDETIDIPLKDRMENLFDLVAEYSHRFSNFKNLNCSGIRLLSKELSNSDLSQVNFSGARLHYLNLSNSTLILANLSGATLGHCDFTNANLSHADLSKAQLQDCILTNANLSYANLTGINLVGMKLSTINLKGANLTDVKLIAGNEFITPLTLQNVLTKFYDEVQEHPQYHEIVKALADQIAKYVIATKKVNSSHAQDILKAAKEHGLFGRNDYVYQNSSMFQPGKSEAMKILEVAERAIDTKPSASHAKKL